MSNQSIVYEQPVNELVRVCLRVEYLLSMTHQGLRGQHLYDTRSTISALMDLLSLTDRPDLRGKFTKELLRQQSNLLRFINQDHIDQEKLKLALSEQEKIIQLLQSQSGKFASSLRENEFLTSVRQHSSMAGGALSFDTPAFYFWLQKPLQERHNEIIKWLNEFEDLFQITAFMLRLVRHSGQSVLHTAHEGFFQTSLDPQMPCQMIRVAVPNTLLLYPEVSVGRHGVSIRFYSPTTKERATPYSKDVPFRLSCCIV